MFNIISGLVGNLNLELYKMESIYMYYAHNAVLVSIINFKKTVGSEYG